MSPLADRLRLAFLLGCGALFAGACSTSASSGDDAGDAPELRIPVAIETSAGPQRFQAEIADTPEARNQGLMFRESLGEREGMLFIFPRPAQRSFWMRNTLISLDIIFVRSDRKILGIVERAEVRTDTPRSVPGPSQFVLELRGGSAEKFGLKAEQPLTFAAPIPER